MIRQAATTIAHRSFQARILPSVVAKGLTARTLAVTKSPGNDPLEVLRAECVNRKVCNVDGYRAPGVHWVFCIALAPIPEMGLMAPNLRTVGIQRVSSEGIDFVMKKGSKTADNLTRDLPVAIMHSQGKYAPGETAEQWRGEGFCETLPLETLVEHLPHYTLTGMLLSKRIEKENLHQDASGDRLEVLNKSHVTEINQRTRQELENGEVSMEELNESVQAFRFLPNRMERMKGGPDAIMWERWEWLKSDGSWNEPKPLLPH